MKSNTREEKQKVQMIIFLSETEENNSRCEGVRGVENRRGGQKMELENGWGKSCKLDRGRHLILGEQRQRRGRW